MATTPITVDARRTDQRTNIRWNPFWISSGIVDEVVTTDATGKAALLFSFPVAGENYLIHEICCEIITNWAGGTITVNVGQGTLATNAITTGGDVTIVTADLYIKTGDIVHGTKDFAYFPGTNASTWITDKAAGFGQSMFIAGVASATVPCIYTTVDTDDAGGTTAGELRVHAMVSRLPFADGVVSD